MAFCPLHQGSQSQPSEWPDTGVWQTIKQTRAVSNIIVKGSFYFILSVVTYHLCRFKIKILPPLLPACTGRRQTDLTEIGGLSSICPLGALLVIGGSFAIPPLCVLPAIVQKQIMYLLLLFHATCSLVGVASRWLSLPALGKTSLSRPPTQTMMAPAY